ncbi:hypothetical protein BaRGS_00010261 [Batillaria attramentaria]|uniref:Noggin n=1 Tax=Batillaria attramentaria TaxID=370345 RepID=A0ABD0LHC5_9CAEN
MPSPGTHQPDGLAPAVRTSGSFFTSLAHLNSLIHVILLLAASSFPTACASHVYLNLLDDESATSNKMPSLHDGTRPSPSDKLPIEDLLENPDQSLDPGPDDLNPRTLLRRLGKHFDKEFLSVAEPRNTSSDSFEYKFKSGRPDSARPDFLQYLRTFKMADGRRVKLKGGKKQRRRVQKLVWSFTFCPVQYTWKDLGVRFWPRWLREGVCWNGRPCSMPPGMTCKPSSSVNKTLLRWHCQSRRPARRRSPCRWITVQYPIITGCSCSC